MLQFNSYNSIQQTPKAKINFGEGRYGSYNSEGKTAEEIKAERIARLIEDASKSEKMPSAARSFFVIGALMSAGALTGAALSRRVFNVLNEMGLLKKITPAVSNVLEKAKGRLDSINKDSLGKIKQAILKATKGTVNYLDDASKCGVEEKLTAELKNQTKLINKVKKQIKKENVGKTFSKEELQKAVNEMLENNPKYKSEAAEISKTIADIKGTNIARKATQATTATFMGATALKEASRDENNNGVADCIEYQHAQKEATQKAKAAILDMALDSFAG